MLSLTPVIEAPGEGVSANAACILATAKVKAFPRSMLDRTICDLLDLIAIEQSAAGEFSRSSALPTSISELRQRVHTEFGVALPDIYIEL